MTTKVRRTETSKTGAVTLFGEGGSENIIFFQNEMETGQDQEL